MIRVTHLVRTLRAEHAADELWRRLSFREQSAYLRAHPSSVMERGSARSIHDTLGDHGFDLVHRTSTTGTYAHPDHPDHGFVVSGGTWNHVTEGSGHNSVAGGKSSGDLNSYLRGGKWKSQASTAACWDGYEQVGFKTKDGRRVPNCVPKHGDRPAPQRKKRKRKAS